jgi:uncharacterized protein (TIGR03437 family)
MWVTYPGSGTAWSPDLDGSGNAVVARQQIAIRNSSPSSGPRNSVSVAGINFTGSSLGTIGVENAADFTVGLPEPGGLSALYVTFPALPRPERLSPRACRSPANSAPVLAVAETLNGSTQVNFQVPYEVVTSPSLPTATAQTVYVIELSFNGQSAFISPGLSPPAIFSLSANLPAFQHATDYSLVTPQNPAQPGEVVIIYATG